MLSFKEVEAAAGKHKKKGGKDQKQGIAMPEFGSLRLQLQSVAVLNVLA
jgi:hypothetical protein